MKLCVVDRLSQYNDLPELLLETNPNYERQSSVIMLISSLHSRRVIFNADRITQHIIMRIRYI